MRLRLLVALLALAAGALLACTDGDGEATATPGATDTPTASPEATPTSTATPTATEAPDDGPRRSGDAEVDAIIEAVEERDVEVLSSLVEYQVVGCTHAQGMGGPPKCEPGQAEGEEMRVFSLALSCEGSWTQTATAHLGAFAQRARGLYAVADNLDVPHVGGMDWPESDTLLVFHTELPYGAGGGLLHVHDGRIVAASYTCGQAVSDLLEVSGQTATITAGPWDTPTTAPDLAAPSMGIEGVDAVLAAVAAYDFGALTGSARRGMELLPGIACVEVPQGVGDGPACDSKNDEQPGDVVPVFPAAYCHWAIPRDPQDEVLGFLDQGPVLRSVVEAPSAPPRSELYPHGDYWLAYELTASDAAIALGARLQVTEAGDVLALWYGCGESPEQVAQFEGAPLSEIEVR